MQYSQIKLFIDIDLKYLNWLGNSYIYIYRSCLWYLVLYHHIGYAILLS
jgi:hypothetical protein